MPTIKTSRDAIMAYITKDGSVIRELMHPAVQGGKRMSLAEATVPVGTTTQRHIHHRTEEIYHIISGRGRMDLGDDRFEVTVGDTILISPKTPHQIANTGTEALILLCCCAPPYSHEDTEILYPKPAKPEI